MNKRIEFYEKNLGRVNYWLQFAEVKNATAIAFVGGVLVLIHTSNLIGSELFKILITIVYTISLIISLISLFPQYKKDINISNGSYDINNDNLLFWNDIAKYSTEDYVNAINSILNELSINEVIDASKEIPKIERVYAEEIITNSRIAKFKYGAFKLSVKFIVSGTILILISLFTICKA